MTLAALGIAWIAGVFLGSKFDISPFTLLVSLIPLLLMPLRKRSRLVILATLCLLALSGGAVYYQAALPPHNDTQISHYNDIGKLTVRGIVSLDPDVQDKSTRLKLAVEAVDVNGAWQAASGMVMVYADRYPAYSYGDRLEVTGKLETPVNFADFDYQSYLARQSVYSTIYYPSIKLESPGHGLALLSGIYNLRHRLGDVMARSLPEPQASLAQGIILGLRANIPDDVNADFSRSGTMQVLAVSGMNLTIVAGLLMLVLSRTIGKRFYLYVWLSLAAVWFYTAISGASPSVMRAAIMASLFLIAELLGRQKNAGPALIFTCAVMAAFNPLVLWDVSFELSALSMAGIIFLYPLVIGVTAHWPEKIKGVDISRHSWFFVGIESFAMTLAATVAVWPVSAHYFGAVSLAALPANIFAVPALPIIMLLGTLSAVAGLIYLPLGLVSGWVLWLFVTYLLLVARIFARLPFAAVSTGNLGITLIITYYALVIVAVWMLARRERTRLMAELATD